MENIEQLYSKYGKLQLQLEIIQNQILETKRAIVAETNKPKEPERTT